MPRKKAVPPKVDQRRKNQNWNVRMENEAKWDAPTYLMMLTATLMDLRDEMKGLRRDVATVARAVRCPNCQDIPRRLERIALSAEAIVAKLGSGRLS